MYLEEDCVVGWQQFVVVFGVGYWFDVGILVVDEGQIELVCVLYVFECCVFGFEVGEVVVYGFGEGGVYFYCFDLVIFVESVFDFDLLVVVFYVVGDGEWFYCEDDVGFVDFLI